MPDAVDRLSSFMDKMAHGDTHYEIVPGTNISTINLKHLQRVGRVDVKHYTRPSMIYNELATTFAHRDAIARFMKSDYDYGVIFEDDAQMVEGTFSMTTGQEKATLIDAIGAIMEKLPEEWHEVNLGRCEAYCNLEKDMVEISKKSFLTTQNGWCAHAYLLSKKGARKLFELLSDNITASNDKIKRMNKDVFERFSVSPRLFDQSGRCGVNGCGPIGECAD
eukprot:CAMPEP_0167790166 /NCGR_PEP_ID=MMETSP0111_2-20121227/11141_1 /TAXON_ID=91324 /ORGANISM="Lotharella globosa, Strain CCCM811" /LENGTH=220 /DNA_ID=CAMNT_0007682517 /DNA_START=287 /DNA_END=949 /DNA_ORIENTATION=-